MQALPCGPSPRVASTVVSSRRSPFHDEIDLIDAERCMSAPQVRVPICVSVSVCLWLSSTVPPPSSYLVLRRRVLLHANPKATHLSARPPSSLSPSLVQPRRAGCAPRRGLLFCAARWHLGPGARSDGTFWSATAHIAFLPSRTAVRLPSGRIATVLGLGGLTLAPDPFPPFEPVLCGFFFWVPFSPVRFGIRLWRALRPVRSLIGDGSALSPPTLNLAPNPIRAPVPIVCVP